MRRLITYFTTRLATSARKRREAGLSPVVCSMAATLSAADGWVLQDSWSYWNCEGWTLNHESSNATLSFSHDADQGTWGAHTDWMTTAEKNYMIEALKAYLTLTEATRRTTETQHKSKSQNSLPQAVPA